MQTLKQKAFARQDYCERISLLPDYYIPFPEELVPPLLLSGVNSKQDEIPEVQGNIKCQVQPKIEPGAMAGRNTRACRRVRRKSGFGEVNVSS